MAPVVTRCLMISVLVCLSLGQLVSSDMQAVLAAASLSVVPSTASPGSSVQASGAGFHPGEIVRLEVGTQFGTVVGRATANTSGSFGTSFSVPSPGGGVQFGTNTVWAIGETSQMVATAQLTIVQGQTGPTVGPTRQVPPSCTTPSASASPLSVVQGGQVSFTANGFAPSSSVFIQVLGPAGTTTVGVATADILCSVGVAISVDFTDPPGVYTIQANGTGLNEQPLQLTGRYTVLSLAPTISPTQFATPTFSVTCPLPQAFVSASALSPGQTTTFGGSGFRPGSFVTVEYVGPGGAFGERFFSPPQLGPAGSTCNLSSLLVVDPSTPLGHYRAILTGPNATGFQVSATAEFDVVAFTGAATPTPFAPAPPPPPPPVGPPPPPLPPGSVAPLSIDQTLTLVDGARVPAVGEASIYEHVIRMRNTSASAVDVRVAVGGRGMMAAPGMGPLAQGQPVGASFATEYSSDSVVLATSANVGQATVRGNSVIWEGQLAAGQSLELRTTVQQTPSTALSLNQPIRGQTLSVVDQRGTTLSVPPIARPVLPPEQRLVQPAPPPVDPVTGSRYFPDTGFAIADDNIWVYYHRRGGMKTFGGPISRVFTLFGVRAQLFERGMVQVDQTGGVSVVNLLEWPFLPYETLGDVSLPAVDEGLIQLAPDPSQPGYGAASQEFVGTFAAEEFEGIPTGFYTAFLTTVLFRDAFFDGRGDPSLVPGFSLEIWGVPTSWPTYQVLSPDAVDPTVVLQRFQRGVMKRDNRAGTTSGIPLGSYVRGVLAGDVALADVAGSNVLWAQYNPAAVDWVDRPDELPDTNFVLAFEPD